MSKGFTKIFRKVSVELDKVNDKLDIIIEKQEKKTEEARKRHEEYEEKSAKEAGFSTVEEWRQDMDKILDDIMKR